MILKKLDILINNVGVSMRGKTFFCTHCDAEFKISHNMDEDYYEVQTCPFCGGEVEGELDFEEDEE